MTVTEHSTTTHCPCNDPSSSPLLLCQACVKRGLQHAAQQRQRAQQAAKQARNDYAAITTFRRDNNHNTNNTNNNNNNYNNHRQHYEQLLQESNRLRIRLQSLQTQCSHKAVQVARAQHALQERQERVSLQHACVTKKRQQLFEINTAFVHGMTRAIASSRHRVESLRFQWAVAALELYRLDVGKDHQHDSHHHHHHHHRRTKRASSISGIGKIGGLPLPHAGPELFGVLPQLELTAALRLVASVTCLVAQCLKMDLPHPIILSSSSSSCHEQSNANNDIANRVVVKSCSTNTKTTSTSSSPLPRGGGGGSVGDAGPTSNSNNNATDASSSSTMASSTASLAGMLLGQSKSVLARAISTTSSSTTATALLQEAANHTTMVIPPSMEASTVQTRIQHARAAVLAERNPNVMSNKSSSSLSSRYALTTTTTTTNHNNNNTEENNNNNNNEDEFAVAWQLLQNDIVALCIQTGVDVDQVWPEAVLLNLVALYKYCLSTKR